MEGQGVSERTGCARLLSRGMTVTALIRNVFSSIFRSPQPRNGAAQPPMEYWKRRVETYGRRAAIHLGHPEGEYETLRDSQWAQLAPWLRREVRSGERVVLDFGCGPGRFTKELAALVDGQAIGMDPDGILVRLAPSDPRVLYVVMPEGRIRSYPDRWMCSAVVWCLAEFRRNC